MPVRRRLHQVKFFRRTGLLRYVAALFSTHAVSSDNEDLLKDKEGETWVHSIVAKETQSVLLALDKLSKKVDGMVESVAFSNQGGTGHVER